MDGFLQQQLSILFRTIMNFDELDDVLDDNSYVPSFSKREPAKPKSFKAPSINNGSQRSLSNDPAPIKPTSKPSGNLFGLHKEAAKNQPTTFEDFFTQKKQEQPRMLEKNTSMRNLQMKQNREDDVESLFSANQRSAMRRPMSRGGTQISPEHDDSETASIPKRMMPPLSKKAPVRREDTNQIDIDFGDRSIKNDSRSRGGAKDKQSLDPLQALSKEQSAQMKKVLEKQMDMQKSSMEKILAEQRQSRKQQIEKLNKIHEQELKKKLQLKDYEIQKLKEYYEMQLSLKLSQQKEHKDLSQVSSKIQQNLTQLQKIETKITDQYSSFQLKQNTEANWELRRKETLLATKEQQLKELQKRLEQTEKELKSDKARFHAEQDRQRNRLDQQAARTNQRQAELQSKLRRKQNQLMQEYDKKREDLNREKQKIRLDNFQVQEKKNAIVNQQRQLKNKIQAFEQKQRSLTEEIHQQKASIMEKQIELSSRMNELGMKESQLDMERHELINKMKILELEKRKLEVEAKGKYDKSILANTLIGSTGNYTKQNLQPGNRNARTAMGSSFEQYHRTISEMRDEMMRSMPKF